MDTQDSPKTTQQLIILGNGFDLACGLKSSYIDFYNKCIKDKKWNNCNFWEQLLKSYRQDKKDIHLWCDIEKIIEKTFGDIYSLLYVDKEFIEKIINHMNDTSLQKKDNKNKINYVNFDSKNQNYYYPLLDDERLKQYGFSFLYNKDKFLSSCCLNYIAYYFIIESIGKLNIESVSPINIDILDFLNTYNQICTILLQELKDLEQKFCKYIRTQLNNKKDKNVLDRNYLTNALNLIFKLGGDIYCDWSYDEFLLCQVYHAREKFSITKQFYDNIIKLLDGIRITDQNLRQQMYNFWTMLQEKSKQIERYVDKNDEKLLLLIKKIDNSNKELINVFNEQIIDLQNHIEKVYESIYLFEETLLNNIKIINYQQSNLQNNTKDIITNSKKHNLKNEYIMDKTTQNLIRIMKEGEEEEFKEYSLKIDFFMDNITINVLKKQQKVIEDWELFRNFHSKSVEIGNYYQTMTQTLQDINLMSFNYTTPFAKLNIDKYFGATINVHGNLCDSDCQNCKGSDIIFGIDDNVIDNQNNKIQKNNSPMRNFSKTYRTLLLNSKDSSKNLGKVLPSNSSKISIKFFGHSLSEADYSYFQSIFDYYNLYDSDTKLIFYYNDFQPDQIGKVKKEQVDAVYKLINEYGKTLTNQDQGKNLLHKLMLEQRISIVDIQFKTVDQLTQEKSQEKPQKELA